MQVYFAVNIIEDEPRIKAVMHTVAKAIESKPEWQSEIKLYQEQIERLIMNQAPLLQIATKLEVPIDELEKFCSNNFRLSLREQMSSLDVDLPMYSNTKTRKRKQEDRRLAYEALNQVNELQKNQWAIRMILGASKQHFQSLRDYVNSYGKVQSGVDAHLPASQTKHKLNNIICEAFRDFTKRGLLIFEPTQGFGDATKLFRNYGIVVASEKNQENYHTALETHRDDVLSLAICLDEEWTFEELLTYSKEGKVLMPPQKTDALILIPQFQKLGWQFDIIDVDPFENARQMVDSVLPILADVSLLFVSVNDMRTIRGISKESAKLYGKQDTPEFREQLWMYDCARYMWQAVRYRFALIPIAVHKCWTASKQQGIDRLYFVAIRTPHHNEIVREYVDRIILRGNKISPITNYRRETIPIIRYDLDVNELNPAEIPNSSIIIHRLRSLLSQYRR